MAAKDSNQSKDSAKSQDLELVLTAMNDNAVKLVDETVKSTVRALFTQTPPDDASTITTTPTVASTTATGATLFDSAAILAALNR